MKWLYFHFRFNFLISHINDSFLTSFHLYLSILQNFKTDGREFLMNHILIAYLTTN